MTYTATVIPKRDRIKNMPFVCRGGRGIHVRRLQRKEGENVLMDGRLSYGKMIVDEQKMHCDPLPNCLSNQAKLISSAQLPDGRSPNAPSSSIAGPQAASSLLLTAWKCRSVSHLESDVVSHNREIESRE